MTIQRINQRFPKINMTLSLIGKAVLVWAGILVLAVIYGAVREAVLIPALGLAYALILSGVLLMSLIFVITYLSLPWMEIRKNNSSYRDRVRMALPDFGVRVFLRFSARVIHIRSARCLHIQGRQYLATCLACHGIGAVSDSKVSGLGVITVDAHNEALVRMQTTLRSVCAARLVQ